MAPTRISRPPVQVQVVQVGLHPSLHLPPAPTQLVLGQVVLQLPPLQTGAGARHRLLRLPGLRLPPPLHAAHAVQVVAGALQLPCVPLPPHHPPKSLLQHHLTLDLQLTGREPTQGWGCAPTSRVPDHTSVRPPAVIRHRARVAQLVAQEALPTGPVGGQSQLFYAPTLWPRSHGQPDAFLVSPVASSVAFVHLKKHHQLPPTVACCSF